MHRKSNIRAVIDRVSDDEPEAIFRKTLIFKKPINIERVISELTNRRAVCINLAKYPHSACYSISAPVNQIVTWELLVSNHDVKLEIEVRPRQIVLSSKGDAAYGLANLKNLVEVAIVHAIHELLHV